MHRVRPCRRAPLAAALALAFAAGCGDRVEPLAAAVPDAEFAPQPWERAFDASEMTVWREGRLLLMAPGDAWDPKSLPPAAGVRIELLAARPDGSPPLVPVAETVTDADGRFRVGPGPLEAWIVRASKPGYARAICGGAARVPGAVAMGDGPFEFALRPAQRLDVRVVDYRDRPRAGVRVLADSIAYGEESLTDESGVARLVTPAGPVAVRATGPDACALPVVANVPLDTDASPLRLVVPPREPLSGWVVSAVDERPVAGAVVLALDDPELRTTTDAAGRFTLGVPRQGRVAAFARGLGWRSYRVPAAGDLEMRLAPGQRVRGRVVDAAGAGVAGARLVAVAPIFESAGIERVLGPVTGDDGAFDFDWLPETAPGSDSDVLVLAGRRGRGLSDAVRPGGDAPVTLSLAGERTVRGRLQRASGAPCEGAQARVAWTPDGIGPRDAAVLGLRYEVRARVDAEGRYALHGLPARKAFELRFDIEGASIGRTIPAGGDVVEDLRLDAGLAIRGRIVDVRGNPVAAPGAFVYVQADNHPRFARVERQVTLGADGSFAVEDLPEGEYGVRARVPGYDVGGRVVDAGSTDVELVAEQPAPLDVEVVFPPGAEPEPIRVVLEEVEDPAARPRTTTVEPSAPPMRGSLPIVRRGRYNLFALGGVWRGAILDLEVPDGVRPPVRVELLRTQRAAVAVVDAHGQPVPGVFVRVAPVGAVHTRVESFATDEGGAADVTGLLPGTWNLRVVSPGLPPAELRFEVGAAGPKAPLEVRLAPHGRLALHVDGAGADGQGDERLFVDLTDEGGAPVLAWTDGALQFANRFHVPSNGTLELSAIPAGVVRVALRRGSQTLATRPVTVVADETVSLRVP